MATTLKSEYVRTKFYKVFVNSKGMKVFQTRNSALAKAIMFATEEYCMKFDNPDGTKVFSFTWSKRLQDIADRLIAWHEESLKEMRDNEE